MFINEILISLYDLNYFGLRTRPNLKVDIISLNFSKAAFASSVISECVLPILSIMLLSVFKFKDNLINY